MPAPEAERQLRAILAVDAVGYSRQSEIDELVAIREVEALGARIGESAHAHGGRVFNTAGDGFLLEFSAASQALICAEEILRASRISLRAGLHLGEATHTSGGDWLGRTVNVAARLQALAAPGEILLSGEVKSALTPPLVHRIRARGAVQLKKMEARARVYALRPEWREVPVARRAIERLRNWVVFNPIYALAASLVTLALIVGAAELAARPDRNSVANIAVLPFRALDSSEEAQFLAASIAPTTSVALRRAGLNVVSQAGRAGGALEARYIVEGEVTRDGDTLRVVMRLDDTASALTIFAEELTGDADETAQLSDRVAAVVAANSWAIRLGAATEADGEVSSALLDIWGLQQRGDVMPALVRAKALGRRYPNNAMAQFLHAMSAGFAYFDIPDAEFEQTIDDALAADARARRLDPNAGEAYIAWPLLIPRHRYAEREAHLRRGLERDPQAPSVPLFLGLLLMEVGRTEDARAALQNAAADDPYNPYKGAALLSVLRTLRDRSAPEREQQARRKWPNAPVVIFAEYESRLFDERASDFSRFLAMPTTREVLRLDEHDNPALVVIAAVASGRPSDEEAAVRSCAEGLGRWSGDMACLVGLTQVGRLDQAFAVADLLYPDQTVGDESLRRRPMRASAAVLYGRPMQAFRSDARFIPLAERLGLLAYWRQSQVRPDFCAREQAPICDVLER